MFTRYEAYDANLISDLVIALQDSAVNGPDDSCLRLVGNLSLVSLVESGLSDSEQELNVCEGISWSVVSNCFDDTNAPVCDRIQPGLELIIVLGEPGGSSVLLLNAHLESAPGQSWGLFVSDEVSRLGPMPSATPEQAPSCVQHEPTASEDSQRSRFMSCLFQSRRWVSLPDLFDDLRPLLTWNCAGAPSSSSFCPIPLALSPLSAQNG